MTGERMSDEGVVETLPPSMLRDLAALDKAVDLFELEHGAEARRRWVELGAVAGVDLSEQQRSIVENQSAAADADVWAALAWEVSCRLELVERVRAELAAESRK